VNRPILRALFRDAYYQVLDNLGFRILGVLFLVPVLATFLIGFREDGLWIAGIWNWSYTDIVATFVGTPSGAADPAQIEGLRASLLENTVDLVLDQLADRIGFVFGIAAISFFVPQMLEKGAADVVFSKPVSRLALFLSRYVAGLIFVGLLSVLLVGGMYLGFWITSDYNDTGLLWSVLTLMYGFAIFHAISCTIGVFTRSTIGAILLTIVVMPFNCGFHALWEGMETTRVAREESAAAHPEEKVEEPSLSMRIFHGALTVFHIAAPKTRDATRIARQLRRRVEDVEPEFSDSDLKLTVAAAPQGFVREPRSSFSKDGLVWIAPHPSGGGEASWKLSKQPLSEVGSRSGYVKKLKKDLGVDSVRTDISTRYTERFEWTEERGSEKRLRRKWVFQVASTILSIDYDAEAEWAARDESEHAAQVFIAGVQIADEKERSTDSEYDRRFGWGGPWQFNAWFSVGTTLLFIAAVLGLGWWRLSRVDF
jgi:hypothetical protein